MPARASMDAVMSKPLDSRRRRNGFLAAAALLAPCLGPACVAATPSLDGPSAPSITEITLERDCFGCPTGSILVLRRSGAATYTITGKARHGTVDRAAKGVVRGKDFDGLARLMVSQGFFGLKEQYGDPERRDGEWTSIGATRDGQEKKVLDRGHAGPPSLAAIEKAIDALRARIDWDMK